MKRVAWILVVWLVLLTAAQADQSTVDQERQKAHIVSRMYEATYGQQEICGRFKDELASLVKVIDQVRHTYPELMRLVESSPYLPQAKEKFKAQWSDSGDIELKQECRAIEYMLQQLLEVPYGQQAANDMIQRLSGNRQLQSVSKPPKQSVNGADGIRRLPLETKWDISQKGTEVTLDFAVNEYRAYKFDITFRYADGRKIDDELRKVTGNGAYQLVTKESADTDQPVIVPRYSQEELEFLRKGGHLVSGTYFNDHPLKNNERIHTEPAGTVYRLTPAGAGVAIPIHLRIEQIDSLGPATIVSDAIIQTKGMASHSADALSLRRSIATIRLRPGNYRLHANTTQSTSLPRNVETSLVATWDPRMRALKDDE